MLRLTFDLDRFTPAETLATGAPFDAPGLDISLDAGTQVAVHEHLCMAWTGAPRIAATQAPLGADSAAFAARLAAAPEEAVRILAGRFALVWFDVRRGLLGCATDRFNTHSLCVWRQGRRITVADRADRAADTRRLDPQALFDYFHFHVIPAPRTVFAGVERLRPGHVGLFGSRGWSEQPWWQPRFEADPAPDFNALRERFRATLRDAVARESAGGRCAAFLSGGTDSSTVVGMLCATAGQGATCYSIGFEAEGYDEMAYARLAARHFGADHREYYLTPDDLVSAIPRVAAYYDQPFGNSSAAAAFRCAELAKADGFTRMLAGDGGDELFGGNARYAKQRVFEYYGFLPGLLRRGLLEPTLTATPLRGLPLFRKAASYVEQARVPLPDRLEQYNLVHRLGLGSVFTPAFLGQVDTGAPLDLQRAVHASIHAERYIDRQLGYDWRFTLADNDLPKVIGTTALAGVEVAFPLLDDAVVDFSLRLPADYKLKGLQLRWFFKEALRGFLPDDTLSKKKQGFGLPFGPWLLKHDGLRRLADDALHGLAARGMVRPDFLRTLLDTHLAAHPGYYGEMVWIAMMMEHWIRAHAPDWRLDAS